MKKIPKIQCAIGQSLHKSVTITPKIFKT